MHRVVDVGAHRAIPHHQLVDLLRHRAVHGIDGLGLRFRRGGVAGRTFQYPRQLRAVPGGRRAGVEQPVGQPVQQIGRPVGAVGQFQLPFAPPLLNTVVVRLAIDLRGPCRDLVVAELGQCSAVGSVQHLHGAGGGDPRDRGERLVADDGQHDVPQLVRNIVGVGGSVAVERSPHLGARVGAGGQLEVPAGVRPAGAAAQRHMVSGQIMVGSVEVDGVELLGRRPLHPGHRRQSLKRRRHGRLDDLELALDLRIPGGHFHLRWNRRLQTTQGAIPR